MATALSLLVLTIIALLAGAAYLWRRPGSKRQALLMLVLALVFAINVAIWSLPTAEGPSPISAQGSAAVR